MTMMPTVTNNTTTRQLGDRLVRSPQRRRAAGAWCRRAARFDHAPHVLPLADPASPDWH